MNDRYDDKILLDYIEGELDAAKRAEVEQWMKQDPPLALMVRQMISDRNELRDMYDPAPPEWVMGEVDQQVERAILFGNYDGGTDRFKRNQRGAMGIIIIAGGLATFLGVVALFVVMPSMDDPPKPGPKGGPGGGEVVSGPLFNPETPRQALAAETSPPDFWQWPSFLRDDWAQSHGRLSPWHMDASQVQGVLGVASAIQQQPALSASQQLTLVSTDPLATYLSLQDASVQGKQPKATAAAEPIYYLFKLPQAKFKQVVETLAADPRLVQMSFGPRTPGIVQPVAPKPKPNPFEHWPRLSPDYSGILSGLLPRDPEPVVPEEVRTAVELLVVIEPASRHDGAVDSLEVLRRALSGGQ